MAIFYIPCFVLGDKYFAGTTEELKAFVDDKERLEKYLRFCAESIENPVDKFVNKMFFGINTKRIAKMIKTVIENGPEDKIIWILYRSVFGGEPTLCHSTNKFDDETFEYALQSEKELCKS